MVTFLPTQVEQLLPVRAVLMMCNLRDESPLFLHLYKYGRWKTLEDAGTVVISVLGSVEDFWDWADVVPVLKYEISKADASWDSHGLM